VAGAVLLELEDVVKDFPVRRGLFPGRREDRVHAGGVELDPALTPADRDQAMVLPFE